MSLTFSSLEKMEEGQRGIEGFFGAAIPAPLPSSTSDSKILPVPPNPTKLSTLKRARSTTPDPPTSVSPAKRPTVTSRLPPLHTGKAKNPLSGFLVKNGQSSKQPPTTTTAQPIVEDKSVISFLDDDDDEIVGESTSSAWICPRCKRKLSVESGTEQKLGDIRREHEDYHFAKDLQDGPRPKAGGGGGKAPDKSTKEKGKGDVKSIKKVKKPEGIKAFFGPKSGKG